jgi:hypothetical protein
VDPDPEQRKERLPLGGIQQHDRGANRQRRIVGHDPDGVAHALHQARSGLECCADQLEEPSDHLRRMQIPVSPRQGGESRQVGDQKRDLDLGGPFHQDLASGAR